MSTTTNEAGGGRPPAKFGGRGAQAAAARKAAAAAAKPLARRSDDSNPTEEPVPVEDQEPGTEVAVPHQADSTEATDDTSDTPTVTNVTLGRERDESLVYVAPPDEADVREQIAHHRRRIIAGNRGLTKGLGQLTRDWVLSSGEHFWAATADNKALKTAGYKSVDEFASSVDLTRDDVYRIRRAVPVYRVIGELVEEPLNERTIRALYQSLTDGKQYAPTPQREENLRQQFQEMKLAGKVSSAGALWARKLLELGPAVDVSEPDPDTQLSVAGDKVEKALKARRFVDLDLLKEAKKESPEIAERYVKALREQYEAAAALLNG